MNYYLKYLSYFSHLPLEKPKRNHQQLFLQTMTTVMEKVLAQILEVL